MGAMLRAAWLTVGLLMGLTGCSAVGVSGGEVNEQFAAELDPARAYRLEPGDIVSVDFIGGEGFDQANVVVRPDGVINTNSGEFDVQGLTLPEAEKKIESEIEGIDRPKVTISLNEPAPRWIWVGGEVPRPGPVTFQRNMTGLEAVMEVGGNLPSGKMWNILLIRFDSNNRRTVHRVNLKDFDRPLLLLPRDIVFVPRTHIANVNVWVEQYIRGILPFNPQVGPI